MKKDNGQKRCTSLPHPPTYEESSPLPTEGNVRGEQQVVLNADCLRRVPELDCASLGITLPFQTCGLLTAEEIKSLLSELRGPYYVMAFLAAVTGLRVSELLALKWSDVDFAAGEIHLTRAVVCQPTRVSLVVPNQP